MIVQYAVFKAKALIITKERDVPEGMRHRPSNVARGEGYSRVHGQDILDSPSSTAW